MRLLEWLKSLRRTAEPATAAAIRRELRAAQEQHAVAIQQRDLCAFDAVQDEAAALRWSHLDEAATALTQRMQVLAAALPAADAREREAAEQAEAVRRERAMQEYEKTTAEAQTIVDAIVKALPDGPMLTNLRDLRDRLASEARDLRAWSNDVRVRRPLDPLAEIRAALEHRIARIDRAKWIGSHPITLGGATTETLTAAAERVATVERTRA